MEKILMTVALVGVTATAAHAGGLDRSGQPIGIIFEDGNYAEFSFGMIQPDVSGVDVLTNPIGNVADNFTQLGGGIRFQFNDTFAGALIVDQPFGSDITYPGNPLSTMLGGTSAVASSTSITALGQYQMNERVSFHGGLRYQTIEGDITLAGLSYGAVPPGGLNGYNVSLAKDGAWGYVAGAAYEIPEIALRIAVTYNSAITHSNPTIENIAPSSPNTTIKSPESINIDFQSGVAADTLVFGSIRYAKWSDLIISPATFDAVVEPGTPNSSISDLSDSTAYTLGVGRRFSDKFSGTVSIGFEDKGDPLVSPLAPSNGQISLSVGGQYTMDSGVKLSGGIRYTKLGNAMPETGTPDVARADFTGNDALSIGLKVGFAF
jgi:long-subunit fatty acid transport protein